MKVVINTCFGGFGISDQAYEKLIEWGIPRQKYIQQMRDEKTGLYLPQPENEGRVIFDRELTPQGECPFNDLYWNYKGGGVIQQRYWDAWLANDRSCDLLIRLVEEMGSEASNRFAKLKVVEIPDGVEWELDEYDGIESIHEVHRSWS